MTKTLKELNLEDDFLFAKVMSDKNICKEFLEKLLEIEIEKVELPENQKVISYLFVHLIYLKEVDINILLKQYVKKIIV